MLQAKSRIPRVHVNSQKSILHVNVNRYEKMLLAEIDPLPMLVIIGVHSLVARINVEKVTGWKMQKSQNGTCIELIYYM